MLSAAGVSWEEEERLARGEFRKGPGESVPVRLLAAEDI